MTRRKKKANNKTDAAARLFFNDEGRPDGRPSRLTAERFTKLLDQHEKNDAKLRRAFRAWEKSGAAIRRAEKRMEKQTHEAGAAVYVQQIRDAFSVTN